MPYREASVPARPTARRCPTCGLLSPPSAQRCDCGYLFATGQQGAPLSLPRHRHDQRARATNALALTGVGLIVLTVVVAALTVQYGTFICVGGFVTGVSMIISALRGR